MALVLISVIIGGCVPPDTSVPSPQGTLDQRPSMTEVTLSGDPSQELKTFDNIEQLKRFLREQELNEDTTDFYADDMVMRTMSADIGLPSMAMAESSVASAPMTKSVTAQDFSSTNVQYESVDEADFIKNDGRYIYMIADNKLVIIDAYDAKNAKILSQLEMEDDDDYYRTPQAKELFISGDKLVLIVQDYEEAFYFERYDILPHQTQKQKTVIHLLDISDRTKPVLEKKIQVSGRYSQSRMIDDVMYLVSQESVRDGVRINEPMVMDLSSSILIKPTIHYFDNPDRNYQFNTITSVDISKKKVIDAKTFMLGYGNTLMVSPENMYIAYQKQRSWYRHQRYDKERFTDVVVPLLPEDLKADVLAAYESKNTEEEQWQQVSIILATFFKEFEEDEKRYDELEEAFDKIADALEEYDTKKELEEKKTIIHKIGLDNGKITYKAKGEINGKLLNQFSLDEYDGMLRLATTVNLWQNRRVQYNNVYVLDKNMKTIGELTGIAEDERIHSARFMGERLYMVTFKQMDPFFVIDLSDPKNPAILGELKIPGYSDYLHPFGKNFIIGIGKETEANDFGGFRAQGIKIALFDVSDVKNPKQVDKVEIGDQGSDTEVLRDHKAFLFDETRNLLVLPVAKVTKRDRVNEYRWSSNIWNGAYVFKVNERGFEEMGRVKHSSQKSDYYTWRTQATVKRSLYMDDNLYTVSDKYLKINDLSDELNELNSLNLPYDGEFDMDHPVPIHMSLPRMQVESVPVWKN